MFDWFKKVKPFRELSYGSPWVDRQWQINKNGGHLVTDWVPSDFDPTTAGPAHALGTEPIVWHVDVVDKDGSVPFHCDSRPTFTIEDEGDGMYFVEIIDDEGSWWLHTEGYPIVSITEE